MWLINKCKKIPSQPRCVDCGFLGYLLRPPQERPADMSEADYFYWTEHWHRIVELVQYARNCLLNDIPPDVDRYVCARDLRSLDAQLIPDEQRRSSLIQRCYCSYFFPYSPGNSPDQHLQLEREHKTNLFHRKLTLDAALITVVGVILAAIIAFFLARYISPPSP